MYANASPVFGLARLGMSASTWEQLMPGLGSYITITAGTTQVRALYSDGASIYVGGDFEMVLFTSMGKNLARFTGTPDGLEPLAYFNGPVDALAAIPFVSVVGLYAGGEFTQNVSDSIPYLAETLLGTGIREAAEIHGMAVFPNPASDHLSVTLTHAPTGQALLEVLDVQGRTLLTQPITARTTTVSIAKIAAGAYTLRLIGEGRQLAQPFIKR